MTDHTTPALRSPLGSGGDGWSVAGAPAAVPTVVAAPKATATGTGVGTAAGNIAPVYGPSVSIAA
ncbi:hypothetical protein GRX01_01295 [Halobaculum sp. WSA2]|uniref:Uncharacterized protein n=1 Tax=Halobaculum saliterrae TaxID=2073113 RepID=A0A6B0SMN7_9EURY|nr:hypothetical protein [Halobaculum saliterrae]MXR39995.1 hypothetical protein [Halobaculum saliterrae]